MATFSGHLDNAGGIIFRVLGEICTGDANRFDEFAQQFRKSHGPEEGPCHIVVSFNSRGGKYLEGIEFGRLLHRNGYGSLIESNAECYSAAAFAFLGGSFLGVVGGWGPYRVVEFGGRLGFHGFYLPKDVKIGYKDKFEVAKELSTRLIEYAKDLQLDIGFIAESIRKCEEEFIIVQTVKQFRSLGIELLHCSRTSFLTREGAANACNYATNWGRPVFITPKEGESAALVEELTPNECRRALLHSKTEADYHRGPLTSSIRHLLEAGGDSEIQVMFADAERLGLVPTVSLEAANKIIRVQGFLYGGGFYVTECIVISYIEGSTSLAIRVIVIIFQGNIEVLHFSHRGDVLYELRDPDEHLLPAI